MGRKAQTIEFALDKYVGKIRDPTTCWRWTGFTMLRGNREVPYVKIANRGVTVRRAAFEGLIQAVPAGVQIRNICGVSLCVNPWHTMPLYVRGNELPPDMSELHGVTPLDDDEFEMLIEALSPNDRNPAYLQSMGFSLSQEQVEVLGGGRAIETR